MRFTQTVTALGAFTSLSAAGPAVGVEDFETTGTIVQERTGRTYIRDASLDQYHAWSRYNGTVPKTIEAAAAAVKKGSVQNKPQQHDISYLVPVNIGTPAKTFHLDIDTGSSDLWVFSSQLAAAKKKGHTIYNPGTSSTSKKQAGETWSIKYGDGSSAGGNVFKDKVKLGPITVSGQAVEAAQHISSQFAREKAQDGLFGFGFSNINQVRPNAAKTWIANVGPKLANNLFCANLRHNIPGSYDIGFINPAHHSGPVHYTPITRANGFWQFKTTGGYYAGKKHYAGSFAHAIADTGTTLLYLTPGAARNYYRNVPSAEFNTQVDMYIFPCRAKLPDFGVVIGGSKRVVPGKFINFAPIGTSTTGIKLCQGGIQASPQTGLQIFGDVFLKSQYVVFDQGNNRIGFANKK